MSSKIHPLTSAEKSKEQLKASRQKSNTSYLKSNPKLDIP